MTEPLPMAADAAYLTDTLRRCGVLGGRVREVAVESSRLTILSRIIRLRLTCDGAADAPASLILKTGHPDGGLANSGPREVEFYTNVAPAMPAIVPRCFDAAFDPDTKAWHLLLEDLTESHHIATAWPIPPTTEQCERMLHGLARVHAAWWDHPRLGVSVGTWLDADGADQHVKNLADQFKVFGDRLGDRLSAERRDLYARLIDAAPRLLLRDRSQRNLTVVHGDAHVWNNFLPRDGGGDVRFFDWDAWRVTVAADDLAYMMALHWYPERRRRMERPLLDHYHAALVAHGVRDYDRRALDDDYRLSALWQITTPMWQESVKIPPLIWWSHLERAMLAVDDLGCRDLLD